MPPYREYEKSGTKNGRFLTTDIKTIELSLIDYLKIISPTVYLLSIGLLYAFAFPGLFIVGGVYYAYLGEYGVAAFAFIVGIGLLYFIHTGRVTVLVAGDAAWVVDRELDSSVVGRLYELKEG